MKLYTTPFSPYGARVELAAALKGLSLQIEAPPGGLGSMQFRTISALGKAPALLVEDVVLVESNVILEFMDERYPNPPLRPRATLDLARMRMLNGTFDNYVASAFLPIFSHIENKLDAAAADSILAKTSAVMEAWTKFCGEGAYLCGDTLGLADCSVLPFVGLMNMVTGVLGRDSLYAPGGRIDCWFRTFSADAAAEAILRAQRKAFMDYLNRIGQPNLANKLQAPGPQ